jgi:segregation and condensation protein B
MAMNGKDMESEPGISALLEAVLYLEGEPVGEDALARIVGRSREDVHRGLAELAEHYATDPTRGLRVAYEEGRAYLAPKQALWPQLKDRYAKKTHAGLSKAAMETLSIIAYSQPITRAEVESLRGVNVDGMVKLLRDKDLIKQVGRRDSPGRPVQYGTTREFLRVFGLSSIADLPKLNEADEERFRSGAVGTATATSPDLATGPDNAARADSAPDRPPDDEDSDAASSKEEPNGGDA